MYSLFLFLLCFITQIAVSEALAHGRYTRSNHADNPNVSTPVMIDDVLVRRVSLGSDAWCL